MLEFRLLKEGHPLNNPTPIALQVFHADHGIGLSVIEALVAQVKPTGFFLKELELPKDAPDALSAIHGPIAGDAPVTDAEVTLKQRSPDRPPSRMVARASRPTRKVTLIGNTTPEGGVVVYTCYGGPPAPREPGDPSLQDDPAALAESQAFWAQHALSLG